MASGGCRKVAFWGLIGCLGVPIGLALILAVVLFVGNRLGQSEPQHPVASAMSVPVAAGRTPAAPAPGGSSGPVASGKDLPELDRDASKGKDATPVNLSLDLSEGEFTIVPGPPGSEIKVDGFFDPKSYELTQETKERDDGGRDIHIGFRRNTPFLFLLFWSNHPENKVTITIPEGVPTALDLRLSKCQSHVELGGLMLTSLTARLSMGDQTLTFERPLASKLAQASLRLSMGDIKIRGLGNARPETLTVQGSMGDVRVSFDGDWKPGDKVAANLRMSMGDFRVVVPPNVRLESRSMLILGDSRRPGKDQQPEDPNAPLLVLQTHTSMGDLTITHD